MSAPEIPASVTPANRKKIMDAAIMDGWKNVLTGLGVKGRDKSESAFAMWSYLNEVDAEHIYGADDMAKKIVHLPVSASLKKGFKWKGIEQDQADALKNRWTQMNLDQRFKNSWVLERIYGGAGMFIVSDDAEDLTLPLAKNAKILSTLTFSRWELQIMFTDLVKDLSDPRFGQPKFYTFQPRIVTEGESVGIKIHHSRIVRFEGEFLPNNLRVLNQYWGDSSINAIQNVLRDYSTVNSSSALIVQDFSTAVFKIKNLADMIANDQDAAILKRVEIVNLAKSIARAVMIDTEGEDYDHKSRSVAGLADLLDRAEKRLVAATHMPNTILLGNSPTGLGGSGSHEQDNWYDYVRELQKDHAKPKLLQMGRVLYREMYPDGDPTKLDLEFEPLDQMDETEQATVRKTQAETDQIYYDMGAVSEDEIAISRFGGDAYSTDTVIDAEARKAVAPPTDAEGNAIAGKGSNGDDIQTTVLNGAQITAMIQVVSDVATGAIPRDAAINVLATSLNIAPDKAEALLGTAGSGFKPTAPVPQVPPQGNMQPPAKKPPFGGKPGTPVDPGANA